MITIFITAFISFFCGAITVVLFLWWLLGCLERKNGNEDKEIAIYETALKEKSEGKKDETNTN